MRRPAQGTSPPILSSVKRFWSEVSVSFEEGLFVVRLDGRPVRSLGGLRQQALAEAVAEEWRLAGEVFSAADLPLTGLAGTAQRLELSAAVEAVAAYGASDLICYRAERPVGLVATQARAWGAWVEWAAGRFEARLLVTEGVMPVMQEGEALARLRGAVAGYDAFGLAGLGVIVPALGSLVLGLAVGEGVLGVEEAYRLSILDELIEEEAWGVDEGRLARRAAVERDLAAAGRFMALAASG